jgi:hypothetical protein
LIVAAVVFVVAIAAPGRPAAQPRSGAPRYGSEGELLRPDDYREWVFLSSGLDMTYGPAASLATASRPHLFNNVFVTPAAYRQFKATGTWPEQTMFVLEIRRAEEQVSINNGGRTQGDVLAIEAAVKDTQRFRETGGWAYFGLGLKESAKAFPATQECYSCHRDNTAVDNTFVQFYPELFAVAKQKGTIKATYDPNRRP